MPQFTTLLVACVFALLLVLVVLTGLTLSRLRAIVRSRDESMREAADMRAGLEMMKAQSADFERTVRQDLASARGEQGVAAQAMRTELGATLAQHSQIVQQQLSTMASAQGEQWQHFGERLLQLGQANERRFETLRDTVEQRLDTLRHENATKLEQMRATVDEKLQSTLEQRLGESFKQVSERLEQVHRGLGEMQTLAAGVGDLKKVLTNVKSRGGWGEVQLGALLGEMLAPGQYAQNVVTRPGSKEHVEYAVKLPGRDAATPCWLPIDAKFPLEDYHRLQSAIERADVGAVEASRKALETFFKNEARTIRDKYIESPHTTDFAILFVPTEGLYAEAVSRPGLAETLQRDFRVMLAGPMNLAALLNSLQLGFRTLAIEQRSTEVWRVLAAVKTEFGKFGATLAKTKEKLDQVGRTLDEAGRKSTSIARKLHEVEALPDAEAERLLSGEASGLVEVERSLATIVPLPPPSSSSSSS